MNELILIVEDEEKISGMIVDYLQSLGYRSLQAEDGKAAIQLFQEETPDFVVLDIMLPGIDGLDVLKRIRAESEVPVLMLTARSAENDKLLGLESGADDYLTKPFSMKELAARIRAILRRSAAVHSDGGGSALRPAPGSSAGESTAGGSGTETAFSGVNLPLLESKADTRLRLGELMLSPDEYLLTKNGQRLTLTATQFRIVEKLMRHPGRVYSRMDLLNSFQDTVFEGYERTIDVHIKNIRKVIEDEPSRPKYIKTVWGVGYKMEEPEDT
jgi:DNA-binding response OmpR family regulator